LFCVYLVDVICKLLNRVVILEIGIDVAVVVSVAPIEIVVDGFECHVVDRSSEVTDVSLDRRKGIVDLLFGSVLWEFTESRGCCVGLMGILGKSPDLLRDVVGDSGDGFWRSVGSIIKACGSGDATWVEFLMQSSKDILLNWLLGNRVGVRGLPCFQFCDSGNELLDKVVIDIEGRGVEGRRVEG
jgi:hypothetical protein